MPSNLSAICWIAQVVIFDFLDQLVGDDAGGHRRRLAALPQAGR
jgi:hypothetical protein